MCIAPCPTNRLTGGTKSLARGIFPAEYGSNTTSKLLILLPYMETSPYVEASAATDR